MHDDEKFTWSYETHSIHTYLVKRMNVSTFIYNRKDMCLRKGEEEVYMSIVSQEAQAS